MNLDKSPFPTANSGATSARGVSRRTVIGTAAWATPVIAASISTPALAASVPGTPMLLLVVKSTLEPGEQFTITALLTSDGVEPLAGVPVQFTLPLGLTVLPSASAVTDAAGRATITVNAGTQAGTFSIAAMTVSPVTSALATVEVVVNEAVLGRQLYIAKSGAHNLQYVPTATGIASIRYSGFQPLFLDAEGNPWSVAWDGSKTTRITGSPVGGLASFAARGGTGELVPFKLAALGNDRVAYEWDGVSAFKATTGASGFVELASGDGRLYGITADGKFYAKIRGVANPWTLVDTPVVARKIFEGRENDAYTILGADGKVYYGMAGGAPKLVRDGDAASTRVAQVDHLTMLGTNGVVHNVSNGTWTAVSAPVKITYIHVDKANPSRRIAIGIDGRAYRSFGGQFESLGGDIGELKKVQIGSGAVWGLTTAGTVFSTRDVYGTWVTSQRSPAGVKLLDITVADANTDAPILATA